MSGRACQLLEKADVQRAEIDREAYASPRGSARPFTVQDGGYPDEHHSKPSRAAKVKSKPLLDFSFRSEPLAVLMHEEGAPPIGCADAEAASKAALCEARLHGLCVAVKLQPDAFEVSVVVDSFLLLARTSPTVPPVTLITLLRSGAPYPAVAPIRRSLTAPPTSSLDTATGRTSSFGAADHGAVDDWDLSGSDGIRRMTPHWASALPHWEMGGGRDAVPAGPPGEDSRMFVLRVRSLDPDALESEGCEIEVDITLLPVRLPASSHPIAPHTIPTDPRFIPPDPTPIPTLFHPSIYPHSHPHEPRSVHLVPTLPLTALYLRIPGPYPARPCGLSASSTYVH